MKTTIEYRDQNNVTVAQMNSLRDGSKDGAVLMAQKYLQQFPTLVAHVFFNDREIVVSGATEWQKRNG